MKKFITRFEPRYRSLMLASPMTEREKAFTSLWQQKKYQEALETTFPDKWIWFAEDIEKEIVCDHPIIAGAGMAFSEQAFAVIHEAFPLETKLNHPFEIDGYKFIWISPPVVEKEDFNTTEFNIFSAKPLYKTVYSENFVSLWNRHGFTGRGFEEITQP